MSAGSAFGPSRGGYGLGSAGVRDDRERDRASGPLREPLARSVDVYPPRLLRLLQVNTAAAQDWLRNQMRFHPVAEFDAVYHESAAREIAAQPIASAGLSGGEPAPVVRPSLDGENGSSNFQLSPVKL